MNFKIGDIVLVSFPFSDFSQKKIRPALVVSNNLKGKDVILCGITSQKDENLISLKNKDLIFGELPKDSFIKAEKIVVFQKNLIFKNVASISKEKQLEVFNNLKKILKP